MSQLPASLVACLGAALLALSSVPSAAASPGTLKLGDPAPPLKVDRWIKGEPVPAMEKGKVYVIECWATWCGPCRTYVPLLSDTQKKYADRGLVVIGLNVWESDLSRVAPFVDEMGDLMNYRIAMDPGGGQTGTNATTWLKAAGQENIPCTFLIDRQSRIAWIGHPLSLERPLRLALDDKLDIDAEQALQAKVQAGEARYMQAMQARAYDDAIAAVDEVLAADPGSARMFKPAKLYALFGKKDYKAANSLARAIGEGNADDQMILAQTATMLAFEDDAKEIDMTLAQSMAERAASMNGAFTWMAHAALAKVYANACDLRKAVEAQKRAIERSRGPERIRLKAQLADYEKRAVNPSKH